MDLTSKFDAVADSAPQQEQPMQHAITKSMSRHAFQSSAADSLETLVLGHEEVDQSVRLSQAIAFADELRDALSFLTTAAAILTTCCCT